MQQQQPNVQTLLANAVDVISGEDGERRNGRQNVARQLGLGKRKNHDRKQRPQNQKFGKGVAPSAMTYVMVFGAASPPLGDRLPHCLYQRPHGDH